MQYCAQQYNNEMKKMQDEASGNSNAFTINSEDSSESLHNKINMIKGMYS